MRFSFTLVVSALVFALAVSAGRNRTLTAEQQAAKDAFEASLTDTQKQIMAAKEAHLNFTAEQKQLRQALKDTFVSNKTKAANQAGFVAVKSELSPEQQANFDAAEGTKGLNLTKEQKQTFRQTIKSLVGKNPTGDNNHTSASGSSSNLSASKSGAAGFAAPISAAAAAGLAVVLGSAMAVIA